MNWWLKFEENMWQSCFPKGMHTYTISNADWLRMREHLSITHITFSKASADSSYYEQTWPSHRSPSSCSTHTSILTTEEYFTARCTQFQSSFTRSALCGGHKIYILFCVYVWDLRLEASETAPEKEKKNNPKNDEKNEKNIIELNSQWKTYIIRRCCWVTIETTHRYIGTIAKKTCYNIQSLRWFCDKKDKNCVRHILWVLCYTVLCCNTELNFYVEWKKMT